MNWADWAIVAIIGLSSLVGLTRGLIREAMALAVWVAALLVAWMFSGVLADRLVDTIATPSLRQMVAFGALWIFTMVIGSMISRLLAQLVSAAGLKGLDRVLGASFGVLRGVIISLVVLMALPAISVDEDPWWKESILIPHVLSLEETGRDLFGRGMSFVQSGS
ncbi:MAG: CvpA family protein [Pseudomonadales bacterium]